MMNNILVTGANGFVGSALCRRLLGMGGKRVVGLVKDRNFKSRQDILDGISVVYGDLCDYDTVRYAMSHYEIDTVFHLGAVTILRQSVVDPMTCYQTNIMGTINVLEAARQVGVEKVVVMSSDKCYGTYEELPYVETMAVQASPDAYSTSKACVDLVSRCYAQGYGVDVSVVRSGNIYGPGDLNMSRLVPRSIIKCLDNDPPQIYKGVGKYKREFVYIDDVVDAFLVIREKGLSGEAYNVGETGFLSIVEVVDKVVKLTGCTKTPEVVEKDFVEIKEQWLDASKLKALGWEPTHGIDRGLEKSVEWYNHYKDTP